LLLDLPSVDRAFDEGKLSVHHIFWDVEQGSHDADSRNHSLKTITEMIYVPDEIPDGKHVILDGSNSKAIDYDVLEVIENFKTNAPTRAIEVETIQILSPQTYGLQQGR
ncbi:MAG: hypothetical protein U1E27_00680, partial [Kiritimatiellia bacterium]|nr:hypothetical protein [Kiritimatiellia bacterium]